MIIIAMIVIVAIFSMVMLFTKGGTSGQYVYWDRYRHAEGSPYEGKAWVNQSTREYFPSQIERLKAAGTSAQIASITRRR